MVGQPIQNKNTGMPRSNLMATLSDPDALTVFIAQAIAFVFTVAEVAIAAVFTPMLWRAYMHAGVPAADFPLIMRTITSLNWYGQALCILVGNALVFWFFQALSKRSWIGVAFMPPIVYSFAAFCVSIAMIVPLLVVPR